MSSTAPVVAPKPNGKGNPKDDAPHAASDGKHKGEGKPKGNPKENPKPKGKFAAGGAKSAKNDIVAKHFERVLLECKNYTIDINPIGCYWLIYDLVMQFLIPIFKLIDEQMKLDKRNKKKKSGKPMEAWKWIAEKRSLTIDFYSDPNVQKLMLELFLPLAFYMVVQLQYIEICFMRYSLDANPMLCDFMARMTATMLNLHEKVFKDLLKQFIPRIDQPFVKNIITKDVFFNIVLSLFKNGRSGAINALISALSRLEGEYHFKDDTSETIYTAYLGIKENSEDFTSFVNKLTPWAFSSLFELFNIKVTSGEISCSLHDIIVQWLSPRLIGFSDEFLTEHLSYMLRFCEFEDDGTIRLMSNIPEDKDFPPLENNKKTC